jgi:signal-transduction protein with cAMP-binding, CBS, and nucleotidyltransferase domain
MTGLLDHIGFPLCRGHIMASNPLWRKTLSQWREQIKYWMRKRSAVTLRLSDVFFDFAHVFGDPELSASLRRFVTSIARQNPSYLQEMYGLQASHRVALGMFRRLQTEIDDLGKPGMINLKYGGTLPLVEAIRLFALQHGVAATSTLDRIDALHRLRVFDDNKKDYLKGALAHITFLLLRQQILDFKAARPVRNLVPKASLSRREKDYLIACFRAVRRLRGDLHSTLSAEIF